jgi:hypothetical protein
MNPQNVSSSFLIATGHIRAMRGGAQSHMLTASDGHAYVVKFANNPQSVRVLANEWLASSIGRALGLDPTRCCVGETPFLGVEAVAEVDEVSAEVRVWFSPVEHDLPTVTVAQPLVQREKTNELLPIVDPFEYRLGQVVLILFEDLPQSDGCTHQPTSQESTR